MVEDLKRQASELYKEHTEKEVLPTSDSLSMKKVTYASLGIVLVLVIVIQSFGLFRSRQNTVQPKAPPPPILETTPSVVPPVEPPKAEPAGLPPAAAPPAALPAAKNPPSSKAALKPAQSEPLPVAPETRPILKREGRGAGGSRSPAVSSAKSAAADARADASPSAQISPLELARQELARDVVIEKSPALAKLVSDPGSGMEYKGWKAEAEGSDLYTVSFTFLERAPGTPLHYVWRVNLTARTITPLSYYARKFP